MDSEVQRDGRLLDIVDQDWRDDQLPMDDIDVPQMELPDPEQEQDNGGPTESLKEQEQKWTDLALQLLHENPSTNNTENPSR
ncbi:anaphase-promoting complex subunit 13-like [Branchiostoma lanceolatum]|uniref:Anaphase-promoting complex subunit 13 n=2 Tax=Branchiostoma TaxID=7737 RepID=A0A6P4Z8S7_BRABE|nr:PREDICTED: anaphase-promoting complex subunit 13-like [Branchiostoma belcheri]CAH1262177.1 ANAPC13 [Branchiostoma lanceolatum]